MLLPMCLLHVRNIDLCDVDAVRSSLENRLVVTDPAEAVVVDQLTVRVERPSEQALAAAARPSELWRAGICLIYVPMRDLR